MVALGEHPAPGIRRLDLEDGVAVFGTAIDRKERLARQRVDIWHITFDVEVGMAVAGSGREDAAAQDRVRDG